MSSSASSAVCGSSASTAATGWLWNSVSSSAKMTCRRSDRLFLYGGSSAAVITAATPEWLRALVASIDLMRACAYGLPSTLAWSMRGSFMSSA